MEDKFVYKATKIVPNLCNKDLKESLFIGCYSSLEKFEEVLKEHYLNEYIKDIVGYSCNSEPSYYQYFLTNKIEIPEKELYNYNYIVVQKIKIDKYDPTHEEALYLW